MMVDEPLEVEEPRDLALAVRQLMDAFTTHDRIAIESLLAPECVWRVPGDNELAGEYVGRPAVMRLFGKLRRMFRVPARFEIVDIATSDERAVVYQYGIAVVGDQTVRMKECLVYRFLAGQIVEVDEFQFDQAAFDRAFPRWSVAAEGSEQ